MTVNVISPTALTNSVPRPKSPRRPDYRGGGHNKDARGSLFVVPDVFHKTFDGTGSQPKIRRRRPHEEMGRFASSNPREPPSEPRGCAPGMDMKDLMSLANKRNAAACVSNSVEKSKEYAVRYGPVAKENLVKCGAVTAHGVTEASIVAADVYRQECTTDNRGDDSMFFVNPQDQSKESNSVVETASSTIEEAKTQYKEQRNDSSKRSHQRDSQQPFRSPRSMRFPEAIHILKDPAEDLDIDISPPRVDRVDTSKVWPDVIQEPQAPLGQQDHTNLRKARLHLFQSNNGDGSEEHARLSRALEDLNRQDKLIGRLQKQLRQTNEALETTNNELKETKAVAQRRQFTATEIRARAVQDRKKMEDALEKESETNRKLRGVISQLQVDASGLKVALRTARNDGARNVKSKAQDPAPTPERAAPQFIAMRAEIVDLRSQLAEAHAAKLEDTSSLHSFGDLEQMRVKLKEVQVELQDLKEKELNVQKQAHRHAVEEKSLREKLEQAESSSNETTRKLEQKIHEVTESESAMKAELVKIKSNLHRVERERSQKRLKAASDMDRVSKQLSKSKDEVAKLNKQVADEQTASKSEIQSLRTELSSLKKKLTLGNQESIMKSTEYIKERRKLQKDLAGQNQEVKALQDKVALQDSKIAELEAKLAKESNQQSHDRSSSQQLMKELEQRKANEAKLQADIKVQKSLLQQSKEAARRWQSQSAQGEQEKEAAYQDEIRELKEEVAKLQAVNASGEARTVLASAAVTEANLLCEIDKLKQTVAELQAELQISKKSTSATDNAKEQSYLNDICLLKATLSEAEDKCKEEKFRAEEERRISREMEAKRVAEIDRLHQEKERARQQESRLLAEIGDLKSKIFGSSSPKVSTETEFSNLLILSKSTSGDEKAGRVRDLELPENVTRLRKELALARARLAAAREESRPFTTPGSPDKSIGSSGSSWVPLFKKDSSAFDDEDALSTTSTESESVPCPPEITKVIDQPILETSEQRSVSEQDDVADLQRQLCESSKRLLDANSKLKGLVRASDKLMEEQAGGTVHTVVRMNSDEESVDSCSGKLDEVRTSPSGNIEVLEKRFCDI